MAARAAHLVGHVFPRVPVRQWVLSLPHGLRYRLAWDHTLCRAVVGCALRAILGFLLRRAREEGVKDGRSGAVAIVQRFGGALNLNIHFHAIALDGVFAKDDAGGRFYPTSPRDAADVADGLTTVEAYVQGLLARRGGEDADTGGSTLDEWADEAPVLAGIAAASVQGRVAVGSRAGARVRRRGDPLNAATEPWGLGPCQARHDGFDLHAGLCVPADQRDRLERVCRYALRPPVAQDLLQLTDDGQVQLTLRRPWADGTSHLLFEPVELLERLAALTPRPRVNLILYHGVLGARAAWRSLVVQYPPPRRGQCCRSLRRGPRGAGGDTGPVPRPELSLGGLDAPQPGSGCARVSSVWRTPPVDRPDRGPGGDSTHPAPPRAPDRHPRGRPARAPPTAGADHELFVDDPA